MCEAATEDRYSMWTFLFVEMGEEPYIISLNAKSNHIPSNGLPVPEKLDHTLARKNDSPTWCGVIVVVWCYCGSVFVVV